MPEVGPLLARGRAADVYEYGDGLVLRRYRFDHDCIYEAAIMQHVSSHGYPAPAVIEAAGPDLVMERLEGPTMLSDFQRRPWRVLRHASTLAKLLHRLHEIPVPAWARTRHADRNALVHLDLHPDNVILTPRGPVVIDWTNAGHGDRFTELADLWLVLTCADAPVSGVMKVLVQLGRRVFVDRLLGTFDTDQVRRKLAVALQERSKDRNMSETELARMQELVRKKAL